MSNLLGSGIVGRCNENFTTINECYLLAIRRYGSRAGTTNFQFGNLFAIIAGDVDGELLCFSVCFLKVNFTVVSIAEQSLVADRKEAYRMSLERGHRLDFFRAIDVHRIYIHGATLAFAQEINGLAIRSQRWVTVFATNVGQICMLASLGIVQPDVTSN